MSIVISIVPLLAVLISLLAMPMIFILRKQPNVRDACSVIAGMAQFSCVLWMVPAIRSGKMFVYPLMNLPSMFPRIGFNLRVDGLGLLFAGVASFLWILTSIYSIGYMRGLDEHSQTRYFICFAGALTGAIGVAFSADLLTMFLFYELLTIITWPLVTHHETAEAYSAGKKYLAYLMGSAKLFLFPAIVFTYSLAGTGTFKRGGIFPSTVSSGWITVIFILFMAGFVKAGMMPFHNWLPSAMIAPTPVSALLHAVAVVKVGVFLVVRIVLDVFGLDLLRDLYLGVFMAGIASFTIIAASAIALRQDNLKARLAYSTISQLSYVILGVMLLSSSGVRGSVVQIVAHAFAKITLFFCAGAIYVFLHKKNVSELSGVAKQLPWTMGAFTVGALSLIGVPPLAGFVSKWWLALGSIEAVTKNDRSGFLFLFVLLSSTLLNAAYFLPIVYKAYFEPLGGTVGAEVAVGRRETSLAIVLPLVVTAICVVVAGLILSWWDSAFTVLFLPLLG